MKNNRYRKSFIFSNKAEDVSALLSDCVGYVLEPKDTVPVPVELLSKIKWVLTELLINGSKHSGTSETIVTLTLNADTLTIEKEDFGNPLQLMADNGTKILTWPIPETYLSQTLEVYQNGMDSLRIFLANPGNAVFSVAEMDDIQMPLLLVTTSEHFGLMIIAKASDHFQYTFDHVNKKNIFSITFNYIE